MVMKPLRKFIDFRKAAGKWNTLIVSFLLLNFIVLAPAATCKAQLVLFDFDSAPLYSSLPMTLSAGGITAHFSAASPGYSIQDANVLGFTPQGFSGHILYPNSIYLTDLIINFDQPLTAFSIMYACQELGCDDAATMRVTAYMNGNFAGTSTKTAANPGTWPVDTLSCSFPQGFDSVVVHYDSPPPTCQDYGVIYLADNMWVTALNTSLAYPGRFMDGLSMTPNPVSHTATISFSLPQGENIRVFISDIYGHTIRILFDGQLSAGKHQVLWDAKENALAGGVYILNVTGDYYFRSGKLVVTK